MAFVSVWYKICLKRQLHTITGLFIPIKALASVSDWY